MYCACGCGQITKIAKRTDTNAGLIKGQHKKFVLGHSYRLNKKFKPKYGFLDEWCEKHRDKHICLCGCNGYITIKHHHHQIGIPKYIHGHHNRTQEAKQRVREYCLTHLGEDSLRWVKDRSKVRTNRTQVDFTSTQKREIYLRDKGLCQECWGFCLLNVHKHDPLKANFDHIVPVKDGGTRDIFNGQLLCYKCHKKKHSAEAKWMNSGKPRTGNPEPSTQSVKVQRLLGHSDMLNNQISVHPEREEIVQSQ